jgi:hypothetical protein
MRMAVQLLVILWLNLVNVYIACAQDKALAAIQKIYSAYNTKYPISFSGSMKMYIKNEPAKIIERMQARYLLGGSRFSCSIGPVEMLLNEKYYVSADKSVRVIIIGNTKDLAATMQSPVLNLDRLSNWIKGKDIDAKVVSGSPIEILQLTDPHRLTGYDRYSISYNPITGCMQQVILELSDENSTGHKTMVLEVHYTRPAIVAETKDVFSEKRFFSLHDTTIQLNNDYTSYQLINQL